MIKITYIILGIISLITVVGTPSISSHAFAVTNDAQSSPDPTQALQGDVTKLASSVTAEAKNVQGEAKSLSDQAQNLQKDVQSLQDQFSNQLTPQLNNVPSG